MRDYEKIIPTLIVQLKITIISMEGEKVIDKIEQST